MDAIQEAKRLFNETWDLLDKADRTPGDDILMLHTAHTSCYLWRSADNPVNNARGEWQVSRVYSVLGMPQPALLHGQYSLDICLQNDIKGLDLAFGYEAVARAEALAGNQKAAAKAKEQGILACGDIQEADDKQHALSTLAEIGPEDRAAGT